MTTKLRLLRRLIDIDYKDKKDGVDEIMVMMTT